MVHFQESLKSWYLKNKRDLPWRHTTDPYKIWLSEVILQQTRVVQGTAYYLKFIEAFPTISHLAKAKEQRVLSLWQGLGYYSRARNLHATAKLIVEDYKGVFPDNYKDLLSLKGVGPYTAAAIASFSFNEVRAVLDGNVFRVLGRIYDIPTAINSSKGTKEYGEISQNLISVSDPATYNQAIMELGALVCSPKSPKCYKCPFNIECSAFKNGTVKERPVKKGKTKVRKRFFIYTAYFNPAKGTVYLKKRTEKDIWQNLYDFQLQEFSTLEEFKTNKQTQGEGLPTAFMTHKLSHQTISAFFILKQIHKTKQITGLDPVKLNDLDNFPLPVLIKKYIVKEPRLNYSA